MLYNDYVKGHIPHTRNFAYYYELDVYMRRQWFPSIKCNWLKLLFKLPGCKRKEITLMRAKLYNQFMKQIMLRTTLTLSTPTHLRTLKNVTISFFPTTTALLQAVSYFSSIHKLWTNHLSWHTAIWSCHPSQKPLRASRSWEAEPQLPSKALTALQNLAHPSNSGILSHRGSFKRKQAYVSCPRNSIYHFWGKIQGLVFLKIPMGNSYSLMSLNHWCNFPTYYCTQHGLGLLLQPVLLLCLFVCASLVPSHAVSPTWNISSSPSSLFKSSLFL